VADAMAKILEPSRRYFEKNKEARESLSFMRTIKITH